MSELHALELGMFGGIALFFIFLFTGLLDKWFR